ncbi:Uu.00g032480.m01.CDS01 [Anthostomella pinea]|uniref:Uu.00g032480.m01.CDS01 n=1 Tax=Anthostomella pinea TaxID=933095 RepID=A0AAI8V9P7_9PEZI|nr:Uu.00g032480.m01.CDS01 [Anthostomella pinea]
MDTYTTASQGPGLQSHSSQRSRGPRVAAVGASIALVVVYFFFAWLSDHTSQRGLTVIHAQACFLLTLIVARQVQHLDGLGRRTRWGLWTLGNSFAVGYHPVHNSWGATELSRAGKRSITIAMFVMSAMSGLMVERGNYFQGDGRCSIVS